MDLIELLHLVIGSPDGRQTGCLCCHNIDTDTVINTQIGHARSDKLHHFILYKSVGKYFPDNGKCDILRADTLLRGTCQVNADNSRHINIVSLIQKLLDKLRTTFSNCHGSQCSVTGMGI